MLFLLSIIYIYILLGTTKLGYIYLLTLITFETTLQQELSLCILLLIGSLFIKIGVIPFHSWIFLIYNIMPFSIFFFFLICTKLSFFYVLFIIYLNFYSFEFLFNLIFVIFGFLNLIIGPFLVFNFKDLKRFLLATSLVSSGYVFFSLINSKLILNTFIFIFYLISSQISLLGIFLVLSLVHEINLFTYVPLYSTSSFLSDSIEISPTSSYFRSLSVKHFIWRINIFLLNVKQFPFLLKCFFISFIFSLLGLPPFIGFFSKYLLLFSLFLYQHSFAFIIIFVTALNGLYYFNFILYIFLSTKHVYYSNNNLFIMYYLIFIFILHLIYFVNFYVLIFFFYVFMLRIFYIYIFLLILEFDKPHVYFITLMSDYLKDFLPNLKK
jgi:NADH:ubiquinone oxidoreductase subunit 2 (subunit N)